MYYYGFSSAADQLGLGIGRNTIFEIMIEKGLIDEKHKPNEELVNAGYLQFENKKKYLPNSYKCIMYGYLTISRAGIEWLAPILKDHLSNKRA